MAVHLTFGEEYTYDTTLKGITIPVTLTLGETIIDLFAKVDTGADFCIFKREHGEALGIDIEAGDQQRFATVAGAFLTYGHAVRLSTFNCHFDVTVYFAADYNFSRNVLGRRGWLDQVRMGLIDYDGKLYVSKYSDEI